MSVTDHSGSDRCPHYQCCAQRLIMATPFDRAYLPEERCSLETHVAEVYAESPMRVAYGPDWRPVTRAVCNGHRRHTACEPAARAAGFPIPEAEPVPALRTDVARFSVLARAPRQRTSGRPSLAHAG